MKKCIASVLVALVVVSTIAFPTQAQAQGNGRGGVMGFFAGCCFGIRAGMDYNDGKEIHWREWATIIPYAGIVFAIWNGIDGANGITRAQQAEKYGSVFY